MINPEENITIVIKTFRRKNSLKKLLRSLNKSNCRNCPIIIVDDSQTDLHDLPAFFPSLKLQLYRLPFDSGVSAGRNAAVDRVTTPYFLLFDDDFYYREIDLGAILEDAVARGSDITTGVTRNFHAVREDSLFRYLSDCAWRFLQRILRRGSINTYHGFLNIHKDYWEVSYWQKDLTPGEVDVGLNFFLAKTETVRNIRWDDDLKTGEHLEFFVRAKKQKASVYFDNRLVIDHLPSIYKGYFDYRQRGIEFFRVLIAKNNIKKIRSHFPEKKETVTIFLNEKQEFISEVTHES